MKRTITLMAVICLCNIVSFAQRKYEMVIEKTDGTEIVINTEDIVRTYFRERNEGNDNQEDANLLGEYQECDANGTLRDDATQSEVFHIKLYNDGTGEFWSVTKGKVDENFIYSFTYTYTFNGNSGTLTQTYTNGVLSGYTETGDFTYSNGIFIGHADEDGDRVYYKKIKGDISVFP